MTSTPPSPSQPLNLDSANAQLADASPEQVIQWAGDTFGQGLVMSTSFGVQSAVMLSLVTKVLPDVPVIFIDTGFHFQETYQFADELTDRLKLNLKVYAADESPSWFVARHGQLWDSDNP
ncbi:MAG: phosphoadenosine phosphosulfate reductase family protein, partial [Planctomycetota bacterium]